MKKYIVKKDMLDAPVGTIVESDENGMFIGECLHFMRSIKRLIAQGFIEEVREPQTLREKFEDVFERHHMQHSSSKKWREAVIGDCVRIARDKRRGSGWVRAEDVLDRMSLIKWSPNDLGGSAVRVEDLKTILDDLTKQ